MNKDNYLFTLNWFKNAIDNKINNKILLIILNLEYKEKLEKIKILEKDLGLDNKKYDYESFDISQIESFNNLKNIKKNVLVIAHPFIDINKISNLECNILLCFYDNILECNSKTEVKSKWLSKKDIIKVNTQKIKDYKTEEYYDNFIERNNPFDVIFSYNNNFISKCIFSKYKQNKLKIFNGIDRLQSNKTISCYIWKKQIKKDIEILFVYKILTARLAIAIYKSWSGNIISDIEIK